VVPVWVATGYQRPQVLWFDLNADKTAHRFGSLRRWRYPNAEILRLLNKGRRIASTDFSVLEFN
jgi:hypothetical protein